MTLACCTVFVGFNYSTGFINDDLSSFKNSAYEAGRPRVVLAAPTWFPGPLPRLGGGAERLKEGDRLNTVS